MPCLSNLDQNESETQLEMLLMTIQLTVHTWEVFVFITQCLQCTITLKDMQVHFSIYLFSLQEFDCFSA